jgi:hypothetical protein
VVVVGLDVQAAYDSVWHAGLIYKLLRLPLPRNLIGWLCDYLKDRKLQVHVQGYNSREAQVNCGVPQGSPLSPLLYIIYTADLLEDLHNTDAYADDLTVLGVGANFSQATAQVQEEIDQIHGWSVVWRQKFNANKSEVMPFAWTPVTIKLRIGGQRIPQLPFMRVLGIHLDPRLNWKHHFDVISQRCARNMVWFNRIAKRRIINRAWSRRIYYALIRSTTTYGNVVYAGASKQQLQRIEVIQNNCLRAIIGVKLRDRVPIVELQQRCRVESLSDFFQRTRTKYAINAVSNVLPLREAFEQVRNDVSQPARSPVVVLNKLLPPQLPTIVI